MTEPPPPAPSQPAGDVLDTPEAGPRVIRGSVLRTAGYVAGMGVGVLGAALMTRHLGPADFGRFITVTSLIRIVAGFTEAGMTTIGIREYSTRTGPERDGLMANLLGLRISLTAAGSGVAVLFAVVAGYGATLVVGTALAGAGLVLTIAAATLGVALSSELRLGWVSALDVLNQALTVVLIAALVVAGAGLLPFLAMPIPVAAVVLALTALLVRRGMPLLPKFDFSHWSRLLRLTVPYAAATAVGVLYFHMAVVVMSLVGTPDEAGYFGAAFRVWTVVAGVGPLIISSAFPILARAAGNDDRARLAYGSQRLFETSLIFGTWLALATVIGAGVAIDVIAGSEFAPATPVLRIQGAAILASFLVNTWGFALLSLHRHRALVLSNLLVLGLGTVLLIVLASAEGAQGAAVATLITEFTLGAAYAGFLMGRTRELRPSPGIVPRVVLATGAACLPLLLGPPEIVTVAAATVVYFAVLLVLRAIPPELWEAFQGLRRAAR